MNAEKNVDAAENSDARAYAIGHLHDVQMGEDIIEYLRGIDATLKPYGGRFIIHGATATVLEGTWTGDMIAIEFPDLDKARTGTSRMNTSAYCR